MKSLWYWTKKDIARLEKAEWLDEVFPIAKKVTNRMYETTGTLPWMVSGPINHGGTTRAENLKTFNHTIFKLDKLGYLLFNQIPMEQKIEDLSSCGGQGENPDPVASIYLPLLETGLIQGLYLISNYETSYGARRECAKAEDLCLKTIVLRSNFELDMFPELTLDAYVAKHPI